MTGSTPLSDWERRFRAPTIGFPHWSRHAPERLVYVSDEDGSWQAYAWDRSAGTRRKVTDEPVGVGYATLTADGERVVWFHDETGDESGLWLAQAFEGGEPEPLLPGAPTGWPEGLTLGRERTVAALADRSGFAVFVSEAGGPAKEIYRDVDMVAIGGFELEQEGFELGGLSADESLLCVQVAQDGDNIHGGLVMLDVRTGREVGRLFDGPGLGLATGAWSPVPGDRRLAVVHEREDLERPAIWDPVTGERRDLTFDLPGVVFPVDWWPDASALLLVHCHDGRNELFRFELSSGELARIPHDEGETHGMRVRPDGAVWYRLSQGHRASRLLDEAGRELLAPAEPGLREGRPYTSWSFPDPVGERVHGFYVTPEGPGPFPIVLKIHGGPNWLYMDHWMPEVQALVDAGFAVGMVNYRGSTMYGRRWRDRIVGDIGFPEVEDIVAGLDDLIARRIADPDRAVACGRSWGGYLTLLALGLHPDRWSAGVAGVPVGDYMESYDESAPSLQAYDRSLIGGVVHDLPEFVRERSPITYVDRVRAPVLVQIGDSDSRCPPRQAFNWVDAYRARGGAVEVYEYGTGHSSFVTDEEVRQWRSVLDFLGRHVPLDRSAT
jgi:pimeloyl-ACP methyl ester carboxylesterase